jgi:hypothetical protein
MKRLSLLSICLVTAVATFVTAGCSKAPTPPTPLAADQIAPELQKAFAGAASPAKELVDEIVAAVHTNGYVAAFQTVQALATVPGLSKEQRFLMARAQLAINGLLQSAQAQGDENAAAAIKFYQRNK